MNRTAYDTSSELLALPFANGIKLIKPAQKPLHSNLCSVDEILNFPFSVYFSNTNNEIQNLNEPGWKKCQFTSSKDAVGKSIRDIAKGETVKAVQDHEYIVMRDKKMVMKDIDVRFIDDDREVKDLSIKFPWYNADNKVIGNFGCAILYSAGVLAQAISLLANTGLLAGTAAFANSVPQQPKGVHFTTRQIDIINELVKGKTAKAIGEGLSLSRRTVEEYILQLKEKVAVNSKSELVGKMISMKSQYPIADNKDTKM